MLRARCALSSRPAGSAAVAGITGTPADTASSRAVTLLPSTRRVSACGPMNTMPASQVARANSGFSDRKP